LEIDISLMFGFWSVVLLVWGFHSIVAIPSGFDFAIEGL
jgi:hypothetical protein